MLKKYLALFIMIACSAQSGWSAGRILVHGHRGARSVLPENTLPAFEHAIEAGADLIELDVLVTKDNVPVVSHDPALPASICSKGSGTRVIREMTLEQFRKWDCGATPNPAYPRQKAVPGTPPPTLEEALALAPKGTFHFNIEMKSNPQRPEYSPPPEEFARLVIEVVRRNKLESRVMLQSFDFRTVRAARKIAPEIPRAALYSGQPRDLIAMTKEAEATILAPNFQLVTKEVVDQAHAAGIPVVPWTANEPAVWDKLIAAGVDAIITDDPAALIAHLKAKGLR